MLRKPSVTRTALWALTFLCVSVLAVLPPGSCVRLLMGSCCAAGFVKSSHGELTPCDVDESIGIDQQESFVASDGTSIAGCPFTPNASYVVPDWKSLEDTAGHVILVVPPPFACQDLLAALLGSGRLETRSVACRPPLQPLQSNCILRI